ncbi:unnamed protein product [Calicophoron daubneyi]|uniref:Acyl-CoA dehydrogenase family member 9 n=1 Tax=Calicophoron daubneyi TaxID=300641 RepID=A0AAV2TCA3_CALDB
MDILFMLKNFIFICSKRPLRDLSASYFWLRAVHRRAFYTSYQWTSNDFGLRRFSTKPEVVVKSNLESERVWPRQAPRLDEAVTPPTSTSVAETSTAPLLKSLFRGQLCLDLLEFPELENTRAVENVNNLHESLKEFVLRLDSTDIDRSGRFREEDLVAMANHGLFGLRVDRGYGGMGLSATQAARALEAAGLDGSVFATISAHNSLFLKALVLAGTEEQKRIYLPTLAAGKQIGAFCLSELSSGSDWKAILTEAIRTSDGKAYVINGHKTWVTNGGIASHLIVFARCRSDTAEQNSDKSDITAFIVDRNSPGVRVGETLDTIGLRGSSTTDMLFENVQVPATNILGEIGDGLQIVKRVMDEVRLDIAASTVGLLRYLISYAAEHCIQRHQFGRPIGDYGLVRAKLSNLALNAFAMESGVFFLAGLIDAQPKRDLSLELAALKIFCSEALWSGVNDCIQLTGRLGLTKYTPFERYFRDVRSLLIQGGTNETLRLMISGAGLKFVAPDMERDADHLQLFSRHPVVAFRTVWRMKLRRRGYYANSVGAGPKVTEGGASRALKDHVHPSLAQTATRLAILVQRLQSLAEALLITFRGAAVDEQMALGRIADCATDLLLVAISLGRASRSVSIGVFMHDYEMHLAKTFAKLAFRRIEANLADLAELDRNHFRVSSEILTHRRYPVEHPLTRVW